MKLFSEIVANLFDIHGMLCYGMADREGNVNETRELIAVRYDDDVAKWLRNQAQANERNLSEEIRYRLRKDMEREKAKA